MPIIERAIDFLMLPAVRMVRRWSFVLTGPVAAYLVATGRGATGAVVVAARLGLMLAVWALAHRLPGERGEAVRDLLMHPRVRAFLRAELDVALTIPRLLLRRGKAPARLCARRGNPVVIALAVTPVILTEAIPVHLMIPAGWPAVHVASVALHSYMLVWLWSWALGSRAWPHTVRRGRLILRGGPLYRISVPLGAVDAVRAERQRVAGERALRLQDGTALLRAGGRIDVIVELSEPAVVDQPLAERTTVTRVGFASDDPEGLVAYLEALRAAAEPGDPAEERRPPLLGLALEPLVAYELARG